MGVWGVGSFENDTAMDLVAELAEVDGGATILASTLHAIASTGTDEVIDSDDAVEALVAAEFLAALKGSISDNFPQQAQEWLEENDLLAGVNMISGPRKEKEKWLTEMALQAIERIQAENSELDELWRETDEHEEWLVALEDLKGRLT
ncbi:MAG: DUF4259 domain-containing protein [Nitrospinota bacterium]|nr:DUF4259 domain-containing protein [Nitrospinota bacterium]MDH5678551.1 DUF4259 domain-containing protein [Nitrospinota bacterium]MDH5756653.1 DUF4259 domain-containing protein [Nitrospinota bacterium]